ncbi:DoxX family membrane protein [Bacillus shivajii]|uniref:DoxX family membrane protein n=1 Tax=Bacillus shivajii TaxID=1983719 RepID=UPI001CFA15BC|nr:DoxX family membrane protein [Bacillus shivajii]UCZ53959.1 DoxX family membrane protein [Bacillus shivajii]
MKRFVVAFIVFLGMVTIPIVVHGHVKWFTEQEAEREVIENIITPLFIVIAMITAVVLAILPQVLPRLMSIPLLKKIDVKLERLRPFTFPILRYGTVVALIIQVLTGGLFAPELIHPGGLTVILTWIAIGTLLIPHRYATRLGAFILFGLFGVMVVEYSVFHMIDYVFYIAIFFALIAHQTKWSEWSFPLLYLMTGLSLCWVAVEKWVYPAMSADIIASHGVPTFGFSPELFVNLSAFIEFVVGYLLIVGILNRLLAFVLTGIFIMTTTLFGVVEIIGHFMIHIILITFIIEGVSFYKPPIKVHEKTIDQMIFVFLNFIFVLSTFVLIYFRFA